MRVLYIAGIGRSGSTLLCRTLGSIPGFVGVGEVMRVFNRGMLNGDLCSCGVPVRGCDLWAGVRAEISRRYTGPPFETLERIRKRATEGWPSVRYFLWPRLVVGRREIDAYRRFLIALYRAIRAVTGARIIVDASKNLMFARLLAGTPGLCVDILHLVRDSRGVAYSFMRPRERPGTAGREEHLRREGPFVTSILWLMANVMAESAGARANSYQLVQYEGFVADPRGLVRSILERIGEPIPEAAFAHVGARSVVLGTDHLIASNPNRSLRGEVELREDVAWRDAMSSSDRWLVSLLTWPQFRRYGYRGRSGQRSAQPAAVRS